MSISNHPAPNLSEIQGESTECTEDFPWLFLISFTHKSGKQTPTQFPCCCWLHADEVICLEGKKIDEKSLEDPITEYEVLGKFKFFD